MCIIKLPFSFNHVVAVYTVDFFSAVITLSNLLAGKKNILRNMVIQWYYLVRYNIWT